MKFINKSSILLYWGIFLGMASLQAQVARDLKFNPLFLEDLIGPTIMVERFSPVHRTSWEAGILFNRLTTSLTTTVSSTRTNYYTYYYYMGGYAAWRWYPFSKPGESRWLFLGAMAAYGGGVFLAPRVKSYFDLAVLNPEYAYDHHQRQLFLGPLMGIKLKNSKRISLEGFVFISPYYKRVSSARHYTPTITGSLGFNLGYRIFQHKRLK